VTASEAPSVEQPGVRLLPAGDAGLLAELTPATPRAVLALRAALDAGRPPGVVDLVPAEGTLLVTFDPAAARRDDVAAWVLSAAAAAPGGAAPGGAAGAAGRIEADEVEIAVTYDGEDLAEVGRLTGLGEAGVVAAHTGIRWRVAFTGFVPGFGYLVPDDADEPAGHRLDVPRRDAPRPRVPAGAVALAAGYTGVYPRPSPGGWQLLGRTGAAVWDSRRDPPALLRPGVLVRFVVSEDTVSGGPARANKESNEESTA
jgi:KipI family sensor histidine kinase inhibitor